MFTKCSLNVHWMFTECVHWMFTECSLNVHWMFIEYYRMFTDCNTGYYLGWGWSTGARRSSSTWPSGSIHLKHVNCSLNHGNRSLNHISCSLDHINCSLDHRALGWRWSADARRSSSTRPSGSIHPPQRSSSRWERPPAASANYDASYEARCLGCQCLDWA
jgi:hypothetical protein